MHSYIAENHFCSGAVPVYGVYEAVNNLIRRMLFSLLFLRLCRFLLRLLFLLRLFLFFRCGNNRKAEKQIFDFYCQLFVPLCCYKNGQRKKQHYKRNYSKKNQPARIFTSRKAATLFQFSSNKDC